MQVVDTHRALSSDHESVSSELTALRAEHDTLSGQHQGVLAAHTELQSVLKQAHTAREELAQQHERLAETHRRMQKEHSLSSKQLQAIRAKEFLTKAEPKEFYGLFPDKKLSAIHRAASSLQGGSSLILKEESGVSAIPELDEDMYPDVDDYWF